MATIILDMGNIKGESMIFGKVGAAKTNFKDQIECRGIGNFVDLPVTPLAGEKRTQGKGQHSEVLVIKDVDKATPLLFHAASAGTKFDKISIRMFRTLEDGLVEYFRYTLTNAYVSRISIDTLAQVQQQQSLAGYGDDAKGNTERVFSERFYEQMWLNYGTVTWTYTPYEGGTAKGAIEGGWDVLKQQPV